VAAADLGHEVAVDDHEVQAELLPHLVLPLQRQARRADDDYRPCAVPQQQLLHVQTRFDGLAQSHVVGEQEVGARGLERSTQRLQLVGLDVGAAAEGRLEGVGGGGGDRAPAHRVHERRERVGVVEGIHADVLWKSLVRRDGVPDLQLPDDREFLPETVHFK
jgi:hypothetical protein